MKTSPSTPAAAANNLQRSTCNLQPPASSRPSVKHPCKSVSSVVKLPDCSVRPIFDLLSSISCIALCAGCTVLTYKSETGEHFTRTSLGSKTSIAHLCVESRTNGVHKVDLRGYKDDNTEALGTITDAAVRAAIAAAKP